MIQPKISFSCPFNFGFTPSDIPNSIVGWVKVEQTNDNTQMLLLLIDFMFNDGAVSVTRLVVKQLVERHRLAKLFDS